MEVMEIQLDAMLEKLSKVNVPRVHTMIVAEINLLAFTAVKHDKCQTLGCLLTLALQTATCSGTVSLVPVSTAAPEFNQTTPFPPRRFQ